MHGADGRQRDVAVLTAHLSRIFGAPSSGVPLELHDQLLDLEGQPVGLPVGPARTIGEPLQATVLVREKIL